MGSLPHAKARGFCTEKMALIEISAQHFGPRLWEDFAAGYIKPIIRALPTFEIRGLLRVGSGQKPKNQSSHKLSAIIDNAMLATVETGNALTTTGFELI